MYYYNCDDCGKPFTRNDWKRPVHRRCDECALKIVRQVASDMHNKSGKYYERYLASMKKFLYTEGVRNVH